MKVALEEIERDAPTITVKPITSEGIVIIKFSQPMTFPSSWRLQKRALSEEDTLKQYIKISMDAEDKSIQDKLKFDYYLSELDDDKMTIQMVFENPE